MFVFESTFQQRLPFDIDGITGSGLCINNYFQSIVVVAWVSSGQHGCFKAVPRMHWCHVEPLAVYPARPYVLGSFL